MYQLAIVSIFLYLTLFQNFLANCDVFIQNERKIFMRSKDEMSFNQAFSTCESESMTIEKNWTESCNITQNVQILWLGQVVNGAEGIKPQSIKWTDGSPPTQGVKSFIVFVPRILIHVVLSPIVKDRMSSSIYAPIRCTLSVLSTYQSIKWT